jgi:hypothetical protein
VANHRHRSAQPNGKVRRLARGSRPQLDDHASLGLGYNFTDFNDRLTNLDYDSKGWFLNLTGRL